VGSDVDNWNIETIMDFVGCFNSIYLAAALGVRAIELGYSVSYYTVEEFLLQLKKRSDIPVSKQNGRAYVKNALVVVNELGYQILDHSQTNLFFQFISARYMKGSTIITSHRLTP